MAVPFLLSKTGVSIVRDGPITYIAGLHLFSEDSKTDVHVGYIASE